MISWRRQAPRKTFQTSMPKPHAVEMPDSAKIRDEAAANIGTHQIAAAGMEKIVLKELGTKDEQWTACNGARPASG
jgi:hypothetical protein